PLMRIRIKLLKGFLDQPIMAGIVFPQEFLAAAWPCPGAITQCVVLVVAHDNPGKAVLDHVPHQVPRLPDSRPPINNIADKNGLSAGVLVNAVQLPVPHLLQQSLQGMCAAVTVTNNVVTAMCGCADCRHDQLAAISLAQPSLSRQVA